MAGQVVIVGTLDSKGDQIQYLDEKIREAGQPTCVIDLGVVGEPWFKPTYDHERVARAAGTTIGEIIELNLGQRKMGEGAANIVRDLHAEGKVSAVVGMGGTKGTNVSLMVLRAVPLGVPKLLMTTVAYSPAMVPELVGGDDLMMLPWIGGLYGINAMARRILETAAGAIAGAARAYDQRSNNSKRMVAVQGLGTISYPQLDQLRPALESRGYEVAVFHATGMAGRTFEKAIADRLISVSLDLQAGVELVNDVAGGVFTAGKHRLEAAGRIGIPQIVSPGAIEVFHWGRDRPLPSKYMPRAFGWERFMSGSSSEVHVGIRSSAKEIAAVGSVMAEKLNMAIGPTAVVIPTQMCPVAANLAVRPFSGPRGGAGEMPPPTSASRMTDYEEGMAGFVRNMKRKLRRGIKLEVLDTHFNDPQYCETVMKLFDEMTKNSTAAPVAVHK